MPRQKASADDIRNLLIAEGVYEDTDWRGLTEPQVQWFIDNYATLLIEEEIESVNHNMSNHRLRMIEAHLAGHAIASSNIEEVRQLTSEMLSDNSQNTYSGQYGQGLYGTTLGQRAMELDKTGRLRDIADPETSGDFWWVTLTE